MKKILYIITQSEWGGAQRYVFDLATNLQKSQEYQIHVAAGGNGSLFTRLKAKNVPTIKLKYLIRAINPFYDLMAYFELKKIIQHINPDIVHINSSKAGILASLAAKKCKVPKIIYTAHGWVFNESLSFWEKWLYKKIETTSARRIDKIICVSEFDRQTGIAAGINPDKLITIHNGIDQTQTNFLPRTEAQNFLLNKIQITTNKLIGCIANFYPTKGLDTLIQAMIEIDATLILIGDGPEEEKLKVKSKKLKEKVIFAGSIENASQYLKAFDLFVLPSRKEGLPYTILEAAAANIPIVATKVGGIPEIIKNNINGYLCNPNNINDLIDKLKKGLSAPLEPKISDFSLADMLQKTKTIYL